MRTTSLLSFDTLTHEVALDLFRRAGELALHWKSGSLPQSLAGRRIGLIVDDSGWRNTTALDLGISAMGGSCTNIPVSLDGKETLEDLAGYLDNWFDLAAVRTPNLTRLKVFARHSTKPVVNLRTKDNHPFETLGDLGFLFNELGKIDNLKIAVVAPKANILMSWIEASKVLPIHVTQIFDTECLLPAKLLAPYRKDAVGTVATTDDVAALAEADVVITDCWPADLSRERLKKFQITATVLDRLGTKVRFLPCPPVTRGEEVSADAMLHPSFASGRAKAYLLFAQNSFIEYALSGIPTG